MPCRSPNVCPTSYVRWLEWRKETGLRPAKRRDGRSTSTAEEVALWRSVMDFLHDMKEEDEEEEEEEEDDEDESPPPEEPVDDLDGPELIPDAGDGLSLSRQLPALLLQRLLPEPLGWLRLATARWLSFPCPLTVGRAFGSALDGGLCACYG